MDRSSLPGHFVSSNPYPHTDHEKALYFGSETRVNAITVQVPKIASYVRSVACLMMSENLDDRIPRSFSDKVNTLSKWVKLQYTHPYVGESFKKEPVAGFGTAFLVGRKHVLTAAHCVCKPGSSELLKKEELDLIRVVFDFTESKEKLMSYRFHENQIHTINHVVEYVKGLNGADWALLELDRETEHDRPALPIKITPQMNEQSPVYMLGHSNGLPMKYVKGLSKGEQSIGDSSNELRQFHMDAFAGNSGSPVFDEEDQVIGMLVRGADDYEVDQKKKEVRLHKVNPSYIESETCQAFLPNTPLWDRILLMTSENASATCEVANRLGNNLLLQGLEEQDSSAKNKLLTNAASVYEQAFKKGSVFAGYHQAYSLFHADQKSKAYQTFSKVKNECEIILPQSPDQQELFQSTERYLNELVREGYASAERITLTGDSKFDVTAESGIAIAADVKIDDRSSGSVSTTNGKSTARDIKVSGNSHFTVRSGNR